MTKRKTDRPLLTRTIAGQVGLLATKNARRTKNSKNGEGGSWGVSRAFRGELGQAISFENSSISRELLLESPRLISVQADRQERTDTSAEAARDTDTNFGHFSLGRAVSPLILGVCGAASDVLKNVR